MIVLIGLPNAKVVEQNFKKASSSLLHKQKLQPLGKQRIVVGEKLVVYSFHQEKRQHIFSKPSL
jgi:hypothetical protein